MAVVLAPLMVVAFMMVALAAFMVAVLAAAMAAAIVKTALSVQETTIGKENADAEDIY